METIPKKCTPGKPYNKLHTKQLEAIRDMNVEEIIIILHNPFAHEVRAVPFAELVHYFFDDYGTAVSRFLNGCTRLSRAYRSGLPWNRI